MKKKSNLSRNGIDNIKNNINNEIGISLSKQKKSLFSNRGVPNGLTCVGDYKTNEINALK